MSSDEKDHFDFDEYSSMMGALNRKGSVDFEYLESVSNLARSKWVCHPDLCPKTPRVSIDTHLDSVPIAIMIDVTGSMRECPKQILRNLGNLMGGLITTGFIPHPQVLFGAFGDYRSKDPAPIQVGNFHDGMGMLADLRKILITAAGGANRAESSNLVLWYFANKVRLECFEKRGKKGYLFVIGDEPYFNTVTKEEIRDVFSSKLEKEQQLEHVVSKLKEKWHTWYIIPDAASGGGDTGVINSWKNLLGENQVLCLNDVSQIVKMISAMVAVIEGCDLKKVVTEIDVDASVLSNYTHSSKMD